MVNNHLDYGRYAQGEPDSLKELFYTNFLLFCYCKVDFCCRSPSHRLCYQYFTKKMATNQAVNTLSNMRWNREHQSTYHIQLQYQVNCQYVNVILNPFILWTFELFICIFWIVFLKKTYYCSSSARTCSFRSHVYVFNTFPFKRNSSNFDIRNWSHLLK